ncbi:MULTISPECIES: hypothetical protein [Nocardiopsis]|uniref:Uncharacterized protein n=1 Tax=Nocardiopsis sinuspersici TaxID=501010 RepID=A0A1V3C1H8_9ACTN|nr:MULTISPECIES: hypothetical protein [Nocardiopsis]OOC54230.1 hypothetical protein NOSIN_10765 [Nocardiopsis sinuspersici]
MDGHTRTRRQRTLAVPLVFLVVMCFLCALCHSAAPQAAASSLAAVDCPEQTQESPAASAGIPVQGLTHPCEAAEGHGLPAASPLFLVALGAALTLALSSAPRPGPVPRPLHRSPAAPHGYGLLTLLCVQRV